MNIELEIDELVLHGIAAADRVAVGEAVQHELTRLLTERGVPPSLEQAGNASVLHGDAIHLRGAAQPQTFGQQVAAAIYRSLETK